MKIKKMESYDKTLSQNNRDDIGISSSVWATMPKEAKEAFLKACSKIKELEGSEKQASVKHQNVKEKTYDKVETSSVNDDVSNPEYKIWLPKKYRRQQLAKYTVPRKKVWKEVRIEKLIKTTNKMRAIVGHDISGPITYPMIADPKVIAYKGNGDSRLLELQSKTYPAKSQVVTMKDALKEYPNIIEETNNDINNDFTLYPEVGQNAKTIQMYSKQKTHDHAYLDSGADSTGIGSHAWIIDTKSDRKATISGFNREEESIVSIGSAYTAVDLPDGQTILLQVNEATLHGPTGKTLLSVIQMRDNNVFVDEKPRKFGGLSCMKKDDYVIPLHYIMA